MGRTRATISAHSAARALAGGRRRRSSQPRTLRPDAAIATAALALTLVALAQANAQAQTHAPHIAIVVVDTTRIATFDPLTALGSTIDGHGRGATAQIFTHANIMAMKSAKLHAISYRLRTELGVEAWHWNPRGRWSDAAHDQGYWTSSDRAEQHITTSYGYRLPRRGSTIDQANEDGYSRLDDGDAHSFWKSNPYLDTRYTGDASGSHPQWVVIDMENVRAVDAIRIRWGVPFATSYDVQYWDGEQPDDADDNTGGTWQTFDGGAVRAGAGARGGDITLRLGRTAGDAPVQVSVHIPVHTPVHARWFRIFLHQSSGRAPGGSTDVRDGLGYAIREISMGRIVNGARGGEFHDIIRHAPNASHQTRMYVSSTDPWHRAIDRDADTEQPGVDLMFSSGTTGGLPMLLPVGVLYDTPENAASLLRYVRRRGYAVPRVELGEEPDGQYVSPDDFATLYMQTAHALHAVDATVKLGGPSFQSAQTGVMMTWKEGDDTLPWLRHFINAMSARGRLERDFGFLSFEWYPFDDVCGPTAPQLAQVAPQLRDAVQQFRRDGVPQRVPILMTEYGYSAFAGSPEVELAGAILNAESVATFLSIGGAETYFYGTEPSSLDRNRECDSWGDNTLFLSDAARRIRAPTATYRGARLLTTAWADSVGGTHILLRTTIATPDNSGAAVPLGAYALRRPDGRVAILLLNRDPLNEWTVALDDSRAVRSPELEVWQLSRLQYEWHPHGAAGYAAPNLAPRQTILPARSGPIRLPPYSVTVVREHW